MLPHIRKKRFFHEFQVEGGPSPVTKMVEKKLESLVCSSALEVQEKPLGPARLMRMIIMKPPA